MLRPIQTLEASAFLLTAMYQLPCVLSFLSLSPTPRVNGWHASTMSTGLTRSKKPDINNIIKAVLDGLNGVAYEDDKQVVEAIGRKYYTAGDGYLWVSVREVKV